MLHTLFLAWLVFPGHPAPDLDADLSALARPLVLAGEVPGLVLGWIAADGSIGTLALGRRGRDDARPPESDAVFEIGSLTKLFTGLCLARAVVRGELALDDPMEAILPEAMRPGTPRAGDAPPVRLVDLATHTSGMADIPGNLARDLSRFVVDYSGYGEDDLAEFLRAFTPRTPPGRSYVYSNVGFGVLGFGLAGRAGQSFEELVAREITEPLGLASTAITLSPAAHERLLVGHDENGDPVAPMAFGSLVGCGALRSDAADLLLLLSAYLAAEDPLEGALELTRTPAFRLPNGVWIGLAWNLALDGTTWLHDGRTAGFSAFVSFDRTRHTAIVVLANGATNRMSELGVLLLRRLLGIPVAPPALRVPVPLSEDALEPLVGNYNATSPDLDVFVTRADDRLYARIPGQPSYRLFPSGPTEFYYRDVPATVSFEVPETGPATTLVLHQNGRDFRCSRREPASR